DRTAVTIVEVQAIIIHGKTNQVAGVHRTTEKFEGIISTPGHFYVVDGSTAAHTTQGEAVQFFVGSYHSAGVFDPYEFEHTGVVQRIGTAVSHVDARRQRGQVDTFNYRINFVHDR